MSDDEVSYRQHRFRRPPGATELLIVRHGESMPSVVGRSFDLVDGHGDPALHPAGVEQAEAVGRRLAGERVDAIYVTTLQRTVQTAAPLVAATGIEPVVEPDLREVFLGEGEGGKLRQWAAAGNPVFADLAREERWDVIPGAEPAAAFTARVRGAVERIVARHADQRVAVFTHGGVIGEIFSQAVGGGRTITFSGSDNGAIHHLVVHGERWTIRRFNDTAHLPGGFDLDAEPGRPDGQVSTA